TTAAITTAAAVPQKSRRSAQLTTSLLRLALDAQPGVRHGVEAIEPDVFTALLAATESLGRLVEAPQGLIHVPKVAAFLGGEQERLFALHRVGTLVGHVERVAREVAVGRLEARVEGLAIMAELLHHALPLLPQSLLAVGELLLAQPALRSLRL